MTDKGLQWPFALVLLTPCEPAVSFLFIIRIMRKLQFGEMSSTLPYKHGASQSVLREPPTSKSPGSSKTCAFSGPIMGQHLQSLQGQLVDLEFRSSR